MTSWLAPLVLALALEAPSPPQPPAKPGAPAAPAYVSPEVHADRTVTFRIQAPRAAEVTLNGDWLDAKPKLTKGDKGIWSATVGPLPPGLFIYSFNVDGVATPDVFNPDVKLRARSAGSIVVIPGDPPDESDARDVPHGTVEVNWHRSAVLGQMRQLWVYLPPGYEKDRRTYPVLYLLHGRNGTAADWTQAGNVNFIMDNLIAGKRAVPMIIVMPWLHALPYDVPSVESNDAFTRYLLEDVMPLVERRYRVAKDRAHRALIGLSMGGAATLTIGLNHPELFSQLAAYSTGAPQAELEKRLAPALAHADKLNGQLRLLWLGCGKQDADHIVLDDWLAKLFTERGLKFAHHPTEGVHNWALWRQYFHETAPLLFQR
jgi:enterochelin esterase family protein